MSNFVLEKIEEVPDKPTQTNFRKLCNEDGKCQFDEFCQEVRANDTYANDLDRIFLYMNKMAEAANRFLPTTKFNSTKDKGKVIAYEFKSGGLRVYIKKSNQIMVVLGGYKKNQPADIKRVVRILKNIE